MITFPHPKFLPPLSPLLITHSNIRTWLILAAMLPYAGAENANFLESCTRCSKPLGHNSDIFMYRGNNPFCSQECRQEQIEIDEAREKRWKKSKKTTTKTNVRTGTAVVA